MKTNKIIVLLSILATFFIACTGEKGAIGPQGVAGQQGAKGPKGDAGVSGEFPKTQTGNFTIKISDWKANTLNVQDDSYYMIVPVKEVTKDVLDKGIVNLYWVFTPTTHYSLPFDRLSYRILSSSYLEKGEGRVRIDIYPSSSTAKASKPSTDLVFRWLVNL